MKQAINTRTQEEYDALMEWRRSKGKSDIAPFTWEVYKAETVIIIGGLYLYYGEKSKCINDGYVIIPYTEFAKANIAPEIDYKAKYEEAVELLEKLSRISKDTGVAGSTWGDTDYDSLSAVFGYNLCLENIQWEIKEYLTKHNDLTNHKDGD